MSTIPSLALIPSGVKASKVYSVLPTDGTGDFYFTRSGNNATRVNSEGLIELVDSNVPRLNYPLIDGVVQGCPSLLLEPERRNFILNSENISGAGWGVSGWTLTNYFISPDGTNNAYSILRTTGVGVSTTLSLLANTKYTYSVYIKNVDATNIQLRVQNAAGNSSGTESNCVVFQVTDQTNTNNFTRITHTFNTGDAGSYNILLGYYSAGEYIVWGAQVEQGSYATSYIPTQGSIVTRVAETCSKTGISSLINSSEGVLYAEISALANDAVEKRMGLQDAGTFDAVRITYTPTSNSITGVVYNNGASQCNLVHIVTDRTIFTKIALKYKENDFSLWVNGIEVATDNSGTTFTNNALDELAFDVNGSANWHGNCKDLRVYNTALTDQELQQLTTL